MKSRILTTAVSRFGIVSTLVLAPVLIVSQSVTINELTFNSSRINAAARSSADSDGFPAPYLILDDTRLRYSARGTGTMTINGAGCCEGINFVGAFEIDYLQETGGRVEITRLQTNLADIDIVFRLLIFETNRIKIRCGETHNERSIIANVDDRGNLTIPSGAASISGASFENRNALGECSGTGAVLTATNDRALSGLLDPAANRVALAGAFNTRVDGNNYNLTLNMTGIYTNRPPQARFGVEGRNLEAFAQGGCPARLGTGNKPEMVVEANDPSGLKMSLRSLSYDPDGAWSRADVALDKWFYARGGDPFNFVAEGRKYGPMNFDFGPQHRLRLETSDRLGAATTADCSFRVVDTTPPEVTPPASIRVPATIRGGVRVGDSPALRVFLTGATCRDLVDLSPAPMPPLVAGAEVTIATIFPVSVSNVTFRCRDRFGNTGTAQSSVNVVLSKSNHATRTSR
jgi:hypothetical protein